jgi:hypothetical protein
LRFSHGCKKCVFLRVYAVCLRYARVNFVDEKRAADNENHAMCNQNFVIRCCVEGAFYDLKKGTFVNKVNISWSKINTIIHPHTELNHIIINIVVDLHYTHGDKQDIQVSDFCFSLSVRHSMFGDTGIQLFINLVSLSIHF